MKTLILAILLTPLFSLPTTALAYRNGDTGLDYLQQQQIIRQQRQIQYQLEEIQRAQQQEAIERQEALDRYELLY